MERVALVTGASSGIGAATALALARNGYRTFAGIRGSDSGNKVPAALRAEAENGNEEEELPITIIPDMDVDSEKAVVSAVSEAASYNQRLDVLVNNAGYGQFGCTEDVPLPEFRRQFETNFFSIVRIIQEAAPIMRRQGSGDIINISSVVGRMGLPGSPAYISSKFALEGLTECLRYELGQFGIRTTLIEPGVVKTGFFDSMRIPESCSDPKYRVLTDHMLAGIKMMVEMGTPPSQVADAVIGAINDEEMLPRYVVGADAEMFMKAKREKSDIEFERYMSEELFPK